MIVDIGPCGPASVEVRPTICAQCARSFSSETDTCPYCGENRQWVFDRPLPSVPKSRSRSRKRPVIEPPRLAVRAGHATFKWMLGVCFCVGVLSTFDAYDPGSVRAAVSSGVSWALRLTTQVTGSLQ